MKRRALLAAVAATAATVAGCTGTGSGTEDSTASVTPSPTDATSPTGTPSPTVSVAATPPENGERGFRAAIEDRVRVSELDRGDGTWELRYHTDVVAGPPFVREQLEIAKQFAFRRSEGASLSATAFHECTTIRWDLPAALARRYHDDEVGVSTLRERIQETTERENDC